MLFYKAEDCLSFPCTTFLFAIPQQMESLNASWPGFENQSMKPALKLLSITLHEWLPRLCQESCKQHFLLHFDPNPCRHIPASTPGSAEQRRNLRSAQHMAPHREGNTSSSHASTHAPAATACLAVSSLISWLIIFNIFCWQHTLLYPI